MAKTLTLKQQYDKIAEEYVKLFCEKQDLEFEFWVGRIGESAYFTSCHSFTLSQIMYDIENKCEKGLILQWSNDMIENHEEKGFINYESYSKGLRYSHI